MRSNIICLILISLVYKILGNDEVIINVKNGNIRGLKQSSEKGRTFYSFRGIPYAEPPTGDRRFKPPVEKKPWADNILDATKDGPICPQIDFEKRIFIGQEDNCLVLNVYTTQLPNENGFSPKAVMVFIHGGGFNFGMGSSFFYDPKSFIDKDVVLVTINYRLGPLGFLSTADEASPGNYGLLDQNAALKWVKNNIKEFGGDSEKVTIFGQSAGGASVVYQTLSPLSKDLFQRAIALSGSSICLWAFQDNPLIRAQMLGIKLACPVHDTQKLIQCLNELPAENITREGYTFHSSFLPIVFAPTLDENFITDTPNNLLTSGKINKGISFMTGITKDEGAMCYAGLNPTSEILTKDGVKRAIDGVVGISIHNEIASELIHAKYLRDADISNEKEMRTKLTELYSHGLFDKAIFKTAHLMSSHGIETFAYLYDYEAPFSSTQGLGIPDLFGVSHFDDMFMVFDELFMPVKLTEKDKKMKNIYQTLLTNFAKYGHPTHELSDIEFLQWQPVKKNKMTIYHINDPITSDEYNIKDDKYYEFWTVEIPEAMKQPLPKTKDEL